MVLRILEGGASIVWTLDGAPEVARPPASVRQQWGFSVDMLRRRGERMDWPDKELLHFLEFGCYEYSEKTQPVSWFAPHSRTVYAHWDTFVDNVRQEISDEWLKGAWSHPPAVPFRIIPGATIPKPRRPNAFHTICNGSVPGLTCPRGTVGNGAGCSRPVANIQLERYLIS